MTIIAFLVACAILMAGLFLGVAIPPHVRWDRRTATMLAIWALAIIAAVVAFGAIS